MDGWMTFFKTAYMSGEIFFSYKALNSSHKINVSGLGKFVRGGRGEGGGKPTARWAQSPVWGSIAGP